jgi:predicted nucleotidyltransferase
MDPQTIQIIQNILWKHLDKATTKAFVFGSRATIKHSKHSDIDIGLKSSDSLPIQAKIKIQEEFENSNLPYIVEIVDFSQVDQKFKQVALKNIIPLN